MPSPNAEDELIRRLRQHGPIMIRTLLLKFASRPVQTTGSIPSEIKGLLEDLPNCEDGQFIPNVAAMLVRRGLADDPILLSVLDDTDAKGAEPRVHQGKGIARRSLLTRAGIATGILLTSIVALSAAYPGEPSSTLELPRATVPNATANGLTPLLVLICPLPATDSLPPLARLCDEQEIQPRVKQEIQTLVKTVTPPTATSEPRRKTPPAPAPSAGPSKSTGAVAGKKAVGPEPVKAVDHSAPSSLRPGVSGYGETKRTGNP